VIDRWRRAWHRRRLKEPAYAYLYEDYDGDEAVSLDCETTGIDVAKAQILSIGAVTLKGDAILTSRRLDFLVRPTVPVPEETILVHHIRPADLEDVALPVDEAVRRVLEFVGPRPLVGYYLQFDVAMLEKHVRPVLGTPLPNRRIEVSRLYYDWRAAQLPAGANIDLRFNAILENLDLPLRDAHDAFSDALMAAMMYQRLKGSWRPTPRR
jgi:DNA polymerase III subunit epsilon